MKNGVLKVSCKTKILGSFDTYDPIKEEDKVKLFKGTYSLKAEGTE